MRIYVMGSTGVGKTTFSKKLSKKFNIDYYELDKIVYNNEKHRTDEKIEKDFKRIISKDSWIIEDVGRKVFAEGMKVCDKIYYLKLNKYTVYKRVLNRWIRQRKGIEKYNYPPNLYQFFDMFRNASKYFKKEKEKLMRLEIYKDKIVFFR